MGIAMISSFQNCTALFILLQNAPRPFATTT
jgi:hypothetical protein